MSSQPVFDAEKKIIGSVSVVRDITEHKQAEQSLRESEALYRTVIETSPDPIIMYDLEGKILMANTQTARTYGASGIDEFHREVKTIFDLLTEEGKAVAAANFGRTLAAGASQKNEYTIRLRNGECITAEINSSTVKTATGEPRAFISVVRDISERKRTERMLREAKQHLDAHLENSPVAIVAFDPSFRIIRWSGTAEKVFGWKADEVLGKAMGDFKWIYEDDSDLVQHVSKDMSGGTRPKTLNINRNYRKDGAIIHCEWYNSAIYNEEGHLNSIFSIILDITDRIEREEALRRSESDLAEAQKLTKIGSWRFDVPTGFIKWSDELYKVFDVDKQDFNGMYESFIQRVYPEDMTKVWETNKKAVERGESFDIEYRIVTSTGMVKEIREIGYTTKGAGGKVIGLFGTAQDITEQKKSEAELRRKNRKLEILSFMSGRLLASSNPQQLIKEICKNVMEFLDCDVFFNYLTADNQADIYLNAYAGIADDVAKEMERLEYGVAVCGCVAQSGQRIISEKVTDSAIPETELIKSLGIRAYACHPLQDQEGVIGTLSFGTRKRDMFSDDDLDMMQTVAAQVAVAISRIKTKLSLRQSEQILKDTQKLSKVGGWEWDTAMQSMTWTDEAYRIHGLEPGQPFANAEEHIKRSIVCYSDEDRPMVLEAFRRCAEYGEAYDLECPFTDAKGRHLWIRTTAKPVLSEGRISKIIGNIMDITERKLSEEALKKAHDELEMRVQERTAELADAVKKLTEHEQLLAEESVKLQEMNTALKVLLQQRDEDKQELEMKVLANVRRLILPYVDKLNLTPLTASQKACTEVITANLENIVSPFLRTLSAVHMDLTPREIEVANLVREGKTAKEIALLLNASIRSVEFHKDNIRRKLKLTHKKTNLTTYLMTLAKSPS